MSYNPDENLYTAEPKLLSIACFPTFISTPISPPNYEHLMNNTSYHRVPENDMGRVSISPELTDLDEGLLPLDPSSNESEGGGNKALGHKFTCHPTLMLRLVAVLIFTPALAIYIVSGSLLATISVSFAICRNILVVFHYILYQYISIRVELRERGRPTRNVGKLGRNCPTWLKPSHLYLILDLAVIVFLIINISINIRFFTGFFLVLIAMGFYAISLVDLGDPDNITIKGSISFSFCKDDDTVTERPAQPQVQQRIYMN